MLLSKREIIYLFDFLIGFFSAFRKYWSSLTRSNLLYTLEYFLEKKKKKNFGTENCFIYTYKRLLYLCSSYLYSFHINTSVYYESYNLFAFNKTILNNVAIVISIYYDGKYFPRYRLIFKHCLFIAFILKLCTIIISLLYFLKALIIRNNLCNF